MPSRKDFLCLRTENVHSSNDVMYRVLLDSGGRIEHLKETGNGRPVYFDGVHSLFFSIQMNKVFHQSDIREVLGLDAFVIGPLGKGLPLSIINVTWRITKRISRHIHYSIWEVMLFNDIPDNSHAARSNRRGSLWNWGCRMLGMYWYRATSVSGMWGLWLSSSRRGCHGRDGCWDAIRITVVPCEYLIFWRVLGTMGAGGKAYTSPKNIVRHTAHTIVSWPNP